MTDFETFRTEYLGLLGECGLADFGRCAKKAYGILDLLTKANAQFNLTAIRDENEALVKHVLDSLVCAGKLKSLFPDGGAMLDVGSGAGFPSLPVAAALENFRVEAIDSTAKKVNHMNSVAEELELLNFSAASVRAEELAAGKKRESYDAVTARAVANLPVLIELCAPLVKVGGVFLAMKGGTAEDEIERAKNGAKILGLELSEVVPYALPTLTDKRYLVIYKKIKKTDGKYPRNYSQISKKPL